MLIAALLLAVGLAIFDIFSKQVSFARTVRDSNYAIYAADTGAECAMYWDFKCESAGVCAANTVAFATSSDSSVTGAPLMCNGQDIRLDNQDILSANGYTTTAAPLSATTSFAIYLAEGEVPYCVLVQVVKKADAGGVASTEIISRGYNTCDASNHTRIERAYLVSY